MQKHWDYLFGAAGFITTLLTKEDVAVIVGIATALVLVPRAIIWWIRVYQTWRDRKDKWKGDGE